MAEVFRVLGGLCVLALIIGSVHASATLPPSVRIPVHLGVTGYGSYVRRTTGLLLWPLVGGAVYLVGSFAPYEANEGGARWITLALLVMLIPVELGAFRKAQRKSASAKRR